MTQQAGRGGMTGGDDSPKGGCGPDDPQALADRARAAALAGDAAGAAALVARGLVQTPDHPALLGLAGALALEPGGEGATAAVALFERMVAATGPQADGLYNLGVALLAAGRPEAAARAWEDALALDPAYPSALFNLARLRADRGEVAAARALYAQVPEATPQRAAACYNLGNLESRLGRLEEAAAWLQEAVARAPGDARAHTNLGVVLRRLGAWDEALTHQTRAVALDPDSADAAWNLANLLLALDRYPEGFALYEARLRRVSWRLAPLPCPPWEGQDPTGRTLLVGAEQGAGDMIQTARFLPGLAARGARVVVEAPPGLERLFAAIEGVAAVVPFGAPPSDADFGCRAFSLPHLLGLTFAGLPAAPGPYLRVPPGVAPPPALAEAAAPSGDVARVGLCWSGTPAFAENATRAMTLADLAPLVLGLPGVAEGTAGDAKGEEQARFRFYALQKGPPAAELAAAPAGLRARIHDLGPDLDDYATTAAAMARLDLVITTDTSVAHLAGALGRPCWVMLATACDWRWGRGRQTSPWYPGMRLLRQTVAGCWADPVDQARRDLTRALGRRGRGAGAGQSGE